MPDTFQNFAGSPLQIENTVLTANFCFLGNCGSVDNKQGGVVTNKGMYWTLDPNLY